MRLVLEIELADNGVDAFNRMHKLYPQVFDMDKDIRTVRMHEARTELVQSREDLHLEPERRFF